VWDSDPKKKDNRPKNLEAEELRAEDTLSKRTNLFGSVINVSRQLSGCDPHRNRPSHQFFQIVGMLLCLSRSRASLRIDHAFRSMAISKRLISSSSLMYCPKKVQQGDKITGDNFLKKVPKESTEDAILSENNKGDNDLKDLSSQKSMLEVLKEIAEINKRIQENETRARDARAQETKAQEARAQENSAKTQQNAPTKDGFFSKEVITAVCLIIGALIAALQLKIAQDKKKLDHEQSREYKILQGIDKACQPWQPEIGPLYVPRPEYEKRVLNAISDPRRLPVNILFGPKGSGKTTILKHCLKGQPGTSDGDRFHSHSHLSPVIYLALDSSDSLLFCRQRIVKALTKIEVSNGAGLFTIICVSVSLSHSHGRCSRNFGRSC
jgi:hypothetical protein